MSIFTTRAVYSPFEYDKAHEFFLLQNQAHWLPSEINMASDIHDWKMVLNDHEKKVIGNILKGFTQTEVFVGEIWAGSVSKWFKKPEIQMMSASFSNMEAIHSVAYAYLNESLGLTDFSGFMHEPTTKAKIDRIIGVKGKSKSEIAKAMAVFSCFTEGISLFSSFMVLLNFSRFNKLKGVGQIIAFSIKDETLHSTAGTWIYNTILKEFPEIATDEFKEEIYEAARITVQLEDDFLDQAFSGGELEGLSVSDVKTFIRHRTNSKLIDIGLRKVYKNLDKEAIERMSWFDIMSSSTAMTDFFSARVSEYSKGVISFDNIFDNQETV